MKLITTTFREAMRTPGFSLLYMGGVAFTVAFTLIYGLLLYAQLGPVYPEYNRSNTVYVPLTLYKTDKYSYTTSLGRALIEEHLRDKLESVEDMTVMVSYNMGYPMVKPDGDRPEFHVEMRQTEPSFFKFYPYRFLAGTPFSQADFESKRSVAVISDKVAARLFASPEEAVGRYISIDHIDYRITGVFAEASALCVDSYGEVFIPYDEEINTKTPWPRNLGGSLKAILHVKPGQEQKLRDELTDLCRRVNTTDTTGVQFYIPLVNNHKEHILTEASIDWDDLHYTVSPAASPLTLYKPFLIAFAVVLL
ncbi:MAG: ABC transporter permease, partial [Duncaniella sp.]|nr:ABC transporter permease [Duncaniella sp.]